MNRFFKHKNIVMSNESELLIALFQGENEEVRKRMRAQDSIMDKMELKWYGYLIRMFEATLPKHVFQSVPLECKKQNRPRVWWKKQIGFAIERRGIDKSRWDNRMARCVEYTK